MDSLIYQFSLLSDTFAHGAYQTQNFNRPELRAPSVKGMIRWWHDALGYSKAHADILFGQAIGSTMASRTAIRIIAPTTVGQRNIAFMPHKGHRGGSKVAISPENQYKVVITQRREELSPELILELRKATEAWLLLGAIGQRSNRAAGSILWEQAPTSQKEFEITASALLGSAKIRFAVLDSQFSDNVEARAVAGDFLLSDAFGRDAPFGSVRPERKPSPLKLKCILIDQQIRLLAVWDRRRESTEALTRGVQMLVKSNKEIGRMLENVLPRLTA
jgi:CRISPR type III-B/RAMP module RAMP protein Cmr1